MGLHERLISSAGLEFEIRGDGDHLVGSFLEIYIVHLDFQNLTEIHYRDNTFSDIQYTLVTANQVSK